LIIPFSKKAGIPHLTPKYYNIIITLQAKFCVPAEKISPHRDGHRSEHPSPETSLWIIRKNPAKNHESANTSGSVPGHPVKQCGVYHKTSNGFSTRTAFSAPLPKSLLYIPATAHPLDLITK
jgi:hypothetical protein